MQRTRTLLIGVAAAALIATSCEWHLETLDGTGSTRPGHTTDNVGYDSAPIIYNGNPHVFYKNADDTALRHAYWNGAAWSFEVLDGAGSVIPGHTTNDTGWQTSALLYNGRPHVFYHDRTTETLRHAYYNGVAWVLETLDGPGGRPGHTNLPVGDYSAPVIYNGRPHVFYWETDKRTLRHAYYNGVAWAFETLDGNGGPNGRTTHWVGLDSSVVLYNGRPHVFYYDQDDGSLRHAYYNGVAWAFETLDGTGSTRPGHTIRTVGRYSSVVLYNGRPHVFYYDDTAHALRHTYWNGTAWGFEPLDGLGSVVPGHTTGNVGQDTATVLYGGRPYVFYEDNTLGLLRRAYWNGSAWQFLIVDGSVSTIPGHTNDVTGSSTSAVASDGRIYAFYTRTDFSTTSLRHAWFG